MALESATVGFQQVLNNALKNNKCSKIFIKKVIPQVIEYIISKRINHPRDEFCERTFEDIEYSIFKRKLKSQDLKWLRKGIREAMRAFEKNCLRELYIIFVSPIDANSVIEYFRFSFRQMTESVLPMFQNMSGGIEELSKATYNLLENVSRIDSAFEPVEIDVKLVMTFYQENIPDNLNLKIFDASNTHYSEDLIANLSSLKNLLGTLETGYHKVKCIVGTTEMMEFCYSRTEEEGSEECVTID